MFLYVYLLLYCNHQGFYSLVVREDRLICHTEEETVSHQLLHCPVVAGVWNNLGLNFEIVASDDICSVTEH